MADRKKRIVVVGGGFGGAYAVKELDKLVDPDLTEVVLLDRDNYMLFYPLLVEAGVGTIEARHVVIPLRKFLGKADLRMCEVTGVDLSSQTVTYQVSGSAASDKLHYDHLVIALGSITKIPDIPGLSDNGFQLKSLVDAISLRDRAIRLLELANTLQHSEARRELLTCIVVGANFTGIEFAGEYHSFLIEAAKAYSNVKPDEIRMIVLEFADKILAATTPKLAAWCQKTLTRRGVDIRVKTSLKEVGPDYAVLTSGERVGTHTVLWAAGIAPNPLIKEIEGLPLNKHGYIDCEPDLRAKGLSNVWVVGDTATVPTPSGKTYSATAQAASHEGPFAARNIYAVLHGKPSRPFHYKDLGSFAAIGRKQAAANVLGVSITGFLGWVLYRGNYLVKMPTMGMKLRLLADWLTELVFKNEPVQLGVHQIGLKESEKERTAPQIYVK